MRGKVNEGTGMRGTREVRKEETVAVVDATVGAVVAVEKCFKIILVHFCLTKKKSFKKKMEKTLLPKF